MLGLFSSKPKPAQSRVAYTLRNALSLHGRELEQVQYATENYVANEIDRKLLLFRADTGERYLVNRAEKELKRIDTTQQLAQANQMRSIVGEIVPRLEGEEEMDGYLCQRYSLAAELPQIVISGEFWKTRIAGLERTAMEKERALDARMQPFGMGLQPGEVVVRSSTRILAAGAEQNQLTRLVSVEERIENLEEMDSLFTYKIVG